MRRGKLARYRHSLCRLSQVQTAHLSSCWNKIRPKLGLSAARFACHVKQVLEACTSSMAECKVKIQSFCVQAEIAQLKSSLSSRSEEVKRLQGQLATSQAETRDMKGKYAELATQAEDYQRRLAKEVPNTRYRVPSFRALGSVQDPWIRICRPSGLHAQLFSSRCRALLDVKGISCAITVFSYSSAWKNCHMSPHSVCQRCF